MSSLNNPLETSTNPINLIINKLPEKIIPQKEKIPKNIGPYELIEKIVESSYSKIYLGKSKYTGDNVAIKIIEKIFFLENMEDLLLIKREIEILKIIKHRNILTLYEIYESKDYIFLVMEYIPGKNLCEMIVTKRRFKEDEAKIIFVQIVDALYYLHKMNICHRNITSNHILFDINNIPKLISFSYSTFYSKNKELKDSFGSLCHACPEIISELPYNAELSDIWSLGTVLYTMVAGYLPFSEENDEKNKDLIICGKVEYPNEMSNKLKDLLKHMMEPNPKKRYDFIKIMKHPWFKPFNEKLIGGCNPLKMIIPTDIKILNILQEKFGFNINNVKNDLINNRYNITTGLYKLLVKKANILGYHSISDYGCKEYLEYKDNINNYYNDGEKKYEIYLGEVQKRMEVIERHIFQFQEKEENIIKELNNLEESFRISNNISNKSNNTNKEISRTIDIKSNKRLSKRISPDEKLKKNLNSESIFNNINNSKEIKKIKSCSNFIKPINSLSLTLFLNPSTNKLNNAINNPNNICKRIKPRRTHFSSNVDSWQDTSLFIKKRKSYLNNSTFFESLLKKTHPDNIRKSDMRKNIMNEINQVIIEEKEKDNINTNDKEKKKSIRFSLSFSDDEDNLDDTEENISKVDSRQLSMFDEDGIKFLKELKMIRSSYVYKNKKNNNEISITKKKFKGNIKINNNQPVSNFLNIDSENIDKEKKENSGSDKIYSTIKSENTNEDIKEKKKYVLNKIKEIKEIDEIIISQKPKEIKPFELDSYYIDNKKLKKLNIDNNSLTEDFCSINYIHNKFKEKKIISYYNDTKKIKKLDIDNNNDIIFPLSCNNNENDINKINKIFYALSLIKNEDKIPKSMNNKNKLKDKIKLVKKIKLKEKKYQSDICHSKYNEDLSFTNISDISEIKQSSIMSPCYINTNIENKENILMNNNNNIYNNYIIDNKSFQSKINISNLSVTHENNIFLGNSNNNTLITYRLNSNNIIENDLNNFYKIHLNNNNYNKNTYSQNHILYITKRNLAQRLKEEIQKSIDKKQIKSSLLNTTNSSNNIYNNNKKSSNKKIQTMKQIYINKNYYKKNNVSNIIKNNKLPEYVNFIKIRQKKLGENENIKKSNGKSVETKKNDLNNINIRLNKSMVKKNEFGNFLFNSSIRNFNNYCCFNKANKKRNDNCSSNKKKQNKSISKRYCNCDKINKEIADIKSNGKKNDIFKEKIQKEQNADTHRSYLNIYEKDKQYKLKKENVKSKPNIKHKNVISPYQEYRKKYDYGYRKILLKINS